MAHLICKKHGKRVFVNPETQVVSHRSENGQCETSTVILFGREFQASDIAFNLGDSCSYCHWSLSDVREYDLPMCNARVGDQPHIFLG